MDNAYDFLSARPKEFKQLSAKGVLFLHYVCPQVEKYMTLFNHYNQINFTLGGEKIFHHGYQTRMLTQHSTLFLKKCAWKQEIGTTKWETLSFYIPDSFIYRYFRENRQHWPRRPLLAPSTDVFIDIKVNGVIRAFVNSLLPFFTQQPEPPEDLLETKFKELMFHILANPHNSALLAYINDMCDQHKTPISEVMEENYHFNLSISDFARMAERSVTTFKRDFLQHYGTSPGKWLTAKRLGYAKVLLDTTDKSVSDIAVDSGFENVTHFSRVFKENYALSPMQQRKKN